MCQTSIALQGGLSTAAMVAIIVECLVFADCAYWGVVSGLISGGNGLTDGLDEGAAVVLDVEPQCGGEEVSTLCKRNPMH